MTTTASKRPLRRTQEERRATSEEALVQAAIEVMKAKGVAGLTLAEVASVAGVSKGLVVHLYANKQGLQLAALARLRMDFTRRFGTQDPHAPGIERIRRYVHGIFVGLAHKDSSSRLFSALLSEALFQDRAFAEGVAAMNNATKQFVRECLEEEQSQGKRLASSDLDALATFIMSWVRGVIQMHCINEVAGAAPVDRDAMLALIDQTLAALIDGPAPEAKQPPKRRR
ncbi:TetR/AcrR family transcriptional regulator [Comamonas serinivorans]|nr:TetR/AcrR family transcriptional regulator [Comamonas serinivorans]